LLGLPLTSGPVSFFLLVEQGPRFAENSARAALLGLLAAAAFCVSYVVIANGRGWKRSLLGAGVACVALMGVLVRVHVGLALTAALVGMSLVALAAAQDKGVAPSNPAPLGRRQLMKRVTIASLIVVGMTMGAGTLGPQASGLLAPLPVLAGLTAASAHRRGQRDAAVGLLRGTVLGLWGAAAFFVAVALMLPHYGPAATYVAASVAAIAGALVGTRMGRVGRVLGAAGRASCDQTVGGVGLAGGVTGTHEQSAMCVRNRLVTF
jgi:hypothetical protein